jgi:hypothetical protein
MKYNILSFLGGILLLAIIMFVKNDYNSNGSIKMLKQQNDSLLQVNLSLDSANSILKEKIQEETIAIESLTLKDNELKSKVTEMSIKIKTLNVKYEKANSYSNDFGSNEISRYFAEL